MLREMPPGVLGAATFTRHKLATVLETCADIDAFWTGATSRPIDHLDAFGQLMVTSALLPGGFLQQGQLEGRRARDGRPSRAQASPKAICAARPPDAHDRP